MFTTLPNFPQILKVSQPEKKQPVTAKHHSGAPQKKEAKEGPSKNASKNKARPTETNSGKQVKHKSVPNSVAPKDSQVNLKVPETKQSAAPKRKKDSGKSVSQPAAKKKKPVVEERKTTE